MLIPPETGALSRRLGLALAASALLLPSAQAATVRIGAVESISPIEISAPRAAAGAGIPGRRELRFDAFGRRFELQLENTPGLEQAAAQRGIEALRGQALGLSGSWARLTRVGGQWVGLVHDGTEYFAVDRAGRLAESNDQARRMPPDALVIYRLRDARVEDASFAGDHLPAGATLGDLAEAAAGEVPQALAATLPDKRLNVGVVVDNEQVSYDGALAKDYAIARMNDVDGIFSSQAGVRIAIAGEVTVLTPGNPVFTKTKPDELLTELRNYRTATATQQATGLTHLFTGRDLEGSTVGIAYLNSVCDASYAASVSEARNTVSFSSLVAAHEIGHTFNAEHDGEAEKSCASTPPNFLMASSLNGSREFSECSLARVTAKVAAARCLVPVDAPDASIGVPQRADIAVKQATTVALNVRSNGNATVVGTRVVIQLPAGVEAAGAGATGGGPPCTVAPGQVECTLGDLPAGASRDVEMSIVAAAAGNTQARVTVSAANDALSSNNTATLRLMAGAGADLGVKVVLDTSTVQQGGTATARITLSNAGLSTATDALLTVTADGGLVAQSGTGTGVSCTTTAGAVTCTPTTLAPGATAELLLPVQAGAAITGAQRLFLRLRSESLIDPQPGNNDATGVVSVAAPAQVPPPVTPAPPAQSGGGGGKLDPALLGLLAGAVAFALARRRTRRGLLVLPLLAGAALGPVAEAEPAPLWEVGMGVGAIAFSDYRGADTTSVYPLPVPYVVYRGRFLQADREGVRGLLIDSPRATLQLSMNATTPVDSDSSSARAGMPDLDPSIEVGPSLDLHLWRSPADRWTVDFRIPLRGALSVSTDPEFIGWQLTPRVNVDFRGPFGLRDWNVGLLAGPIFADRRYHEYFYRVDPAFATPQRPAYSPEGGYSGAQVLASASRRFERTWFGAFVRYDRLEGASFVQSPLVRRHGAVTAGFGFAWIFATSSRLVDTGR